MSYHETQQTNNTPTILPDINMSRVGISLSEIHGKIIEAYSNPGHYSHKVGSNSIILGDGKVITI